MIGFGDPRRVHELLALRSRSFAARIDNEAAGGRSLELGRAFAFDWRRYRQVHDFGDEALRRLPELLEWFTSGPAPVIETYCGPGLATAAEGLIVLGYQPFHAQAVFAASLETPAPAPTLASDSPTLELSTDPEDFGRLGAQMWHQGDPERAAALARQHAGPSWRCVTAREGGRPVAGASLFLDGLFAFHANALTLPAFQGRGLHGQLLRAHLDIARAQGKRWFVADTQVGSGSGRNLERAGLRCVATCLSWQPRSPATDG
ncbi:hypothetical protein ENSA5_21690 [Enhygromyxa salina]|uniref:N-acetyltransferase domain-containing protein n=1 Tax=Enhygromyxa salina TaxID=215803 RepID=A0A2S9YBN4_9BACT|nr:GNAT family N-acetyltransferase [Enhygromyxa salina]PRQ02524.1 hypothetical protein ENSA5_21690 [Enhygromyxa salina]